MLAERKLEILAATLCRTCGIRTYAQGNLDSLGGTFHAVSVPALDPRPNSSRRFRSAT